MNVECDSDFHTLFVSQFLFIVNIVVHRIKISYDNVEAVFLSFLALREACICSCCSGVIVRFDLFPPFDAKCFAITLSLILVPHFGHFISYRHY